MYYEIYLKTICPLIKIWTINSTKCSLKTVYAINFKILKGNNEQKYEWKSNSVSEMLSENHD